VPGRSAGDASFTFDPWQLYVASRLFDVPSVWEPYASGPVDAPPRGGSLLFL